MAHKTSKADDEQWVCVGTLAGAHGVKGEARIKPFTADPKTIKKFSELYMDPDMTLVNVKITRVIKGGFAGFLEGFDTREEVMQLNGRKLYVHRENLPELEEEEYYLRDLVGLKVKNDDGEEIGTVKDVSNFGAGDLLELHLSVPRKEVGFSPLIPFKKEIVTEVNVKAGYITVLLEAWLESQEIVEGEKSQKEG